MNFYTTEHKYYCGIDLHARRMYICIVNQAGEILHHKNHKATPGNLFRALAPYRDDVVVSVECMFSWYWVADCCDEEEIPFVLGHALYMRAIFSISPDRQNRQRRGRLRMGFLAVPNWIDWSVGMKRAGLPTVDGRQPWHASLLYRVPAAPQRSSSTERASGSRSPYTRSR